MHDEWLFAFFSTISYSIVKCSFVCLFVNARDPCKINIEKYTNVVLFYAFQLNIDPTTAYPHLCVCMFVCLAAWFSALECECVCACVSVCTVLCKGVCVRACVCVSVCLSGVWFSA